MLFGSIRYHVFERFSPHREMSLGRCPKQHYLAAAIDDGKRLVVYFRELNFLAFKVLLVSIAKLLLQICVNFVHFTGHFIYLLQLHVMFVDAQGLSV